MIVGLNRGESLMVSGQTRATGWKNFALHGELHGDKLAA
jgi:hypothetical protein